MGGVIGDSHLLKNGDNGVPEIPEISGIEVLTWAGILWLILRSTGIPNGAGTRDERECDLHVKNSNI